MAGRVLGVLSAAFLTGCPWPGAGPGCEPLGSSAALPDGLGEASGVAVSRAHPGVFWVHDDGNSPLLVAVDGAGAEMGRVRIAGVPLTDWEDLELAACGDADCLYLADTGDNLEARPSLRVIRLREPNPRADSVASDAEVFTLTLPDGPRDVEALFVLPGERIHLVSKGARHPVTVYRAPEPPRAGPPLALIEVQRLGDEARALPRQVTGASATPDGARVLIRTYEQLGFFRVEGDTLAADGEALGLRPLREPQGEGVGAGEDGTVALVSEAGPLGERGSIARMRCQI